MILKAVVGQTASMGVQLQSHTGHAQANVKKTGNIWGNMTNY